MSLSSEGSDFRGLLVSGDPSETWAGAASVCWLRDVMDPTQKLGLLSQSNLYGRLGKILEVL